MKAFLFGGLLVLLSVCTVRADYVDLEPVTCAQFKAGYDILSSQPFSAEDGSLAIAIDAIADNRLRYSDETKTAYATREQLAAHFARLSPISALTWLQTTYTAIETQLKICSGSAFEQKRLVLLAPKPLPSKPGAKTCGSDKLPDLSKPLSK